MNKYFHIRDDGYNYRLLIVRSMKLTILMTFLFVFQVSSKIHAQLINLSVRNAALEEVMTEIRKQSAHNIIFQPGTLEKAKKVTVNITGEELRKALDRIFEKQEITYAIIDRSIVLSSPAKETTSASENVQERDIQGVVDRKSVV